MYDLIIGRATFASSKSTMIDYYSVLGLQRDASGDEIKAAYRELAMKFHPDVNTTGETHQPNAEKFREIAEAYAVLSIPENKSSYDASLKKRNPDAIFSSVKSETMEKNRKMRDATGNVPAPKPVRGSYAEHRLKVLEKERKKFNVSHLGYYNGGLPRKDLHNVRGSAAGPPGVFHDPKKHNTIERFERDSHEVGILEAEEFSNDATLEYEQDNRVRPYYKLETDPTWRYVRNRTFATGIIAAMFAVVIAEMIYTKEKMRAHRTARLPENLDKAPAHHFVNKGGVLIEKEFTGFARYFKNDKELTDWYYKVYPKIMNEVPR